jgi:hypothetical protein
MNHVEDEFIGIPNLYWGSVSLSSLRHHQQRFIGLLRDEETITCCHHSYRYLRQHHSDDNEALSSPSRWARLHDGCLSTGILADLLGFSEKSSLALLKDKRPPEHDKLMQACEHLALPLDPLWGWEEGHEASSAPCPGCVHPSADGPTTSNNTFQGTGDLIHKGVEAFEFALSRNYDAGSATTRCEEPIADYLWKRRRSKCIVAAKGGMQGVRCGYGSIAEGRALLTLLQHVLPPTSTLHECGMMVPCPRRTSPSSPSQPSFPLGASPDAIVCHRVRRCDLGIEAGEHERMLGLLNKGKLKELALFLLSHVILPGASNAEAISRPPLDDEGSLSLEGIQQNIIGAFVKEHPISYLEKEETWLVREVIEIKSTCPFAQRSRSRGSKKAGWVIHDRGPREQVSPHWMPQLQMQMHCSQCATALLVSSSATKGMRVFRVCRNEEYLDMMLSLAVRVQSDFGPRLGFSAGCSPPPGLYLGKGGDGDKEQRAVLLTSVRLARHASSAIVAFVDQPENPPLLNEHAFI